MSFSLAASAAETVTYTYDSLGRLTRTSTTGGPNAGLKTGAGFDPADNRVGYAASTAPGAPMPNSTTAPAPSHPSFSVGNAPSVSEGGTLVFTITKAGSTPLTYSVTYATANGTATGSDYTVKSGMLSFGGSETSKTVSVETIEDVAAEANETVLLNLSNATGGATIGDAQGSGTIANDDAANTPPVAATDSTSLATCSTKTINVTANDTDADGDLPLTVISASGNGRVGASVASATSVQLSSGMQTGATAVSYTIKDSGGATDSGTISVTVTSGGICV